MIDYFKRLYNLKQSKSDSRLEYLKYNGFKEGIRNGYRHYKKSGDYTHIVFYNNGFVIVWGLEGHVNEKYLDTRVKFKLDEILKDYNLGDMKEYKLWKRSQTIKKVLG